MVLCIALICVGIFFASIWDQLLHNAFPCSSCMVSRTGLFLIGAVGIMMLRYGYRYYYIGLVLIIAIIDIYIGIRHSTFHHIYFNDPLLEPPFLGYLLPDWMILVEMIVIMTMGIVLWKNSTLTAEPIKEKRPFTLGGKIVTVVFFVLLAINTVQSFALTGPPPLTGPSAANGYFQWEFQLPFGLGKYKLFD